jgi:magnesium and cobalt exporter, CNNM family
MISVIVALGLVGLMLSALFSGSETGFYRMSRIRLVLDARGGDPIARGLVWLSNRPALFVATTLVGNNLANYLVSFSLVLASYTLLQGEMIWAELLLPILLAPVLFIYGELLPKKVFLQSPNRMIRRFGIPLIAFLILFLPVSLVVWGLYQLLSRFFGENTKRVLLRLARHEIQGVIEEGHAVGILRPIQQRLSRSVFALAGETIEPRVIAIQDYPRGRTNTSREELLRLARQHRTAHIPIEKSDVEDRWAGSIRVVDLQMHSGDDLPELDPLPVVKITQPHLEVMVEMEKATASLARVVDSSGATVGWITVAALREPLFRGNLA